MSNILITGAGGVLGKACVETFTKKGHQVIAILSPGKSLPFENKNVAVYHADLSDEKITEEVIDSIITKHKTVDAGLMLVGGFSMGTIAEADGENVKKMISLNFETAYYTSRKLFSQMSQQPTGGRLVFVGAKPSLDAKAGKGSVAYTLSKSLVFKLAEILNAEGKDKNVVATVVVPSIIDTEANRKSMPKADPNNWVKAEEIAEVINFAISKEGSKLREPILKIYGSV